MHCGNDIVAPKRGLPFRKFGCGVILLQELMLSRGDADLCIGTPEANRHFADSDLFESRTLSQLANLRTSLSGCSFSPASAGTSLAIGTPRLAIRIVSPSETLFNRLLRWVFASKAPTVERLAIEEQFRDARQKSMLP